MINTLTNDTDSQQAEKSSATRHKVVLRQGLTYPSALFTLQKVVMFPRKDGLAVFAKLFLGDRLVAEVDDGGTGREVIFVVAERADPVWAEFVAEVCRWRQRQGLTVVGLTDRAMCSHWVSVWVDTYCQEKLMEDKLKHRLFVRFEETPRGKWVALKEYTTKPKFMEEVAMRFGKRLKEVYIGKKPAGGLAAWEGGATLPDTERGWKKVYARISKVPVKKKGV